ncbi:MAG: DUF1320 domain-containing protein [Polyangiaceae bacterium]|nr:DUF1320 domain-containing protein [Polyangiaceae bacterium]
MANKIFLDLLPVSDVDASGVGATIDIGTVRSAARVRVLSMEWDGVGPVVHIESSSNETTWRRVGSLALSSVGVEEYVAVGLDRYIRVAWELTGLSAMLQVTGTAQQLYANRADLEALNLGRSQLLRADEQRVNRALVHASELAAGYIGARFAMPLVLWGDDLSGHTASVAAYRYMVSVGYAPEGSDEHIRMMYDDAIRWFERVASGELSPDGIEDSTPDISEGAPSVVSVKARGW